MKKIISLATAFIIVFSVCLSSSAGSYDNPPETVKINNQYGFRYTEYTDAEHRTVRTYSATDNTNVQNGTALCSLQSDSDYLRTKSILSSLGMGDDFIAELSDEQLNEYASSESIYASTEYIRTDMNGNQTTVSEEEALNASASVNPTAAPPTDDFVDDGGGDYPVYYDIMTDEYMKLVLVISYKGNAEYNFSVDATWLTAPTWRLQDCLGITMTKMALSVGTCSGWYSYTQHTVNGYTGTSTETPVKNNFPTSGFNLVTNGSWNGIAVTFKLPNQSSSIDYMYYQTNMKYHMEFTGAIDSPDSRQNFMVSASYDHMKAKLSLSSPSISISSDGTASASIGFDLSSGHDRRTIIYPEYIQYEP